MRRPVVIAGAAALVALLLCFSYFSSHLGSHTRTLLSDLEGRLGVTLRYRSIDTSLLPHPVATIHDLVVEAAEPGRPDRKAVRTGRGDYPLLSAARARLSFGGSAIPGFSSSSATLELIDPELDLSRSGLGAWRDLLQALSEAARKGSGGPRLVLNSPTAAGGADPPWLPLSLSELGVVELALTPQPDGEPAGIGFAISGPAFGEGSQVEANGQLYWGRGLSGGHRLVADCRVSDADVRRLRAVFPGKIHESLSGRLELSGHAEGFIGEESTESAPAAPLRGNFHGKVDWSVLERTDALEFGGDFTLDDVRVAVDEGSLSWGGFTTGAEGWMSLAPGSDFSLRLPFEDWDTARLATRLGAPPAWRPKAQFTGELRASGRLADPRFKYEGHAASLELPAIEGYQFSATDVTASGALLAINAVASLSLRAAEARVGEFIVPDAAIGGRYFRERFTVSSLGRKLWGGKVDISGTWKPERSGHYEIGGKLSAVNATTVAEKFLSGLGIDVEGRASAVVSFVHDDTDGDLLSGRADLQRGTLRGRSTPLDFFDQLSAATGRELLTATLKQEFPNTFIDGATPVRRLSFDFQRKEAEVEIGALNATLGELRLRAAGKLDRARRLGLEGAVEVSKALTGELTSRARWLEALVGDDGRLDIPVVLDGAPGAPALHIREDFLPVLRAAVAGRPAAPFESMSYPPIEMNLPELAPTSRF